MSHNQLATLSESFGNVRGKVITEEEGYDQEQDEVEVEDDEEEEEDEDEDEEEEDPGV